MRRAEFTSLECNKGGTRCAAAYRDGRVLVRGDLSHGMSTGQKGYGHLVMSSDGERLLFMPEKPGKAIQWTFGPAGSEELPFPVKQWDHFSASADACGFRKFWPADS